MIGQALHFVRVELMVETGCDGVSDVRRRTIGMLIDGLASLSVPPPDLPGIHACLLAGKEINLVDQLHLDSLGAMEFCIHLELEAGLVVSPEDLVIARSAQPLLSLLESRLTAHVADSPEAS